MAGVLFERDPVQWVVSLRGLECLEAAGLDRRLWGFIVPMGTEGIATLKGSE